MIVIICIIYTVAWGVLQRLSVPVTLVVRLMVGLAPRDKEFVADFVMVCVGLAVMDEEGVG